MLFLHYNILRNEDIVELSRVTSIAVRKKRCCTIITNSQREYQAYLKSIHTDFFTTAQSYEWGIAPLLQNQIYKGQLTPMPVFNDTVLGVVDTTHHVAFNRT